MSMPVSQTQNDRENTFQLVFSSAVFEAIERALWELRSERVSVIAFAPKAAFPPTKSGRSADQVTTIIEDLDRSIERLETIKGWLTEDHHLLALVDEAIGQHVRQMERQGQRFDIRLALTTTIGGALLGWFLAAISSPQDLLRLLGH